VVIEKELPPDFSFKECLLFLDRGLDDIMHRVVGTCMYKPVRLGEDTLTLEIKAHGDKLQIMTQSSESRRTDILSYVERWFDLRRDLKPFYRLLARDKDLAILKKKYRSLHLIGIPDMFETLCWCVMGQQKNLAFAYRIKRRLVEKYGTLVTETPCELYLFPTPMPLAEVSIEELRALQLTNRKAEWIKGIANAFLDGTMSETECRALPEELVR